MEQWQTALQNLLPGRPGQAMDVAALGMPCLLRLDLCMDPLAYFALLHARGLHRSAPSVKAPDRSISMRASRLMSTHTHTGQELARLRAADKEAASLRTREARLQAALAEKNLENLELRWRLASSRDATNPSLAQARLLNPVLLTGHLLAVSGDQMLQWAGTDIMKT